jgi:plastocyanin
VTRASGRNGWSVSKIARVLLLALVSTIAIGLPGSVRAAAPVLNASVGSASSPNAFKISLTDESGNAVTHLDPGPYTIVVHDFADIHNFHLTGPGVNESTDVVGTGTFTWNVVFQDGRYHYQCDPHFTELRGNFTAGNPPVVPKLNGRVGPGRTISLKTSAGALVKTLAAGKYTVVVKDLTKADNFHLSGPGVNRKTAVRSRASASWTVSFATGVYRYRSDAHRALTRSFRVVAKTQAG